MQHRWDADNDDADMEVSTPETPDERYILVRVEDWQALEQWAQERAAVAFVSGIVLTLGVLLVGMLVRWLFGG